MRIRTLLKFVALFMLILFGTEKMFNFLNDDLFKIANINIDGDYFMSEFDIVNNLENLKSQNIWYVDVKKIEKIIEKDIRIKTIKIKKILPDTIDVKIEERKPCVYILLEGRIYIANEKGVIFGYRNESIKKEIPLLSIKNEKEIEYLINVIDLIKNLKLKNLISEIYIDKHDIILLLRDGVKFRTNLEVKEKKYDVAYRLYVDLKKKNEKINYIDLSSESDVFVVK